MEPVSTHAQHGIPGKSVIPAGADLGTSASSSRRSIEAAATGASLILVSAIAMSSWGVVLAAGWWRSS